MKNKKTLLALLIGFVVGSGLYATGQAITISSSNIGDSDAIERKITGASLTAHQFNRVLDILNPFSVSPSGQIGLGDDTPDGGLKFDVNGSVGANVYCDQNGNNCVNGSSLANKNNFYTKYQSDQRYASKWAVYTRSQSDQRYATKTYVNTKKSAPTISQCQWIGNGQSVFADSQVHSITCPASKPVMSGWKCSATKYLDGDCAAYCCGIN